MSQLWQKGTLDINLRGQTPTNTSKEALVTTITKHYAGFWIRALALGIDIVLYSFLLFLIELAFGHNTLLSKEVGAAVIALFYIACLSSPWQGTPGKKLLRLRIENVDSSIISVKRAMIRCFVVSIPFLPMVLFSFHPAVVETTLEFQAKVQNGLHQGELATYFYHIQQHRPIMLAYGLSTLFFILSVPFWYLPAAFTKEKKTVHDMLSGTRVVHIPK